MCFLFSIFIVRNAVGGVKKVLPAIHRLKNPDHEIYNHIQHKTISMFQYQGLTIFVSQFSIPTNPSTPPSLPSCSIQHTITYARMKDNLALISRMTTISGTAAAIPPINSLHVLSSSIIAPKEFRSSPTPPMFNISPILPSIQTLEQRKLLATPT